MNKLIAIGFTGLFRVYLNISEEEAKQRYTKTELMEHETIESSGVSIIQFDFDDEFGSYMVNK